MHITALLTCFNRKDKTLACLERLFGQILPSGTRLDAVLVDDGSRDGTAEAVAAAFPAVTIVRGSGSLFWCGGMRAAWQVAAKHDPDYYLLANDDTMLDTQAVGALLALIPEPTQRTIGVAAIRDPGSGIATYGGIRAASGLVPPTGSPEACDTFNGNAVLIPRAVFREMGMLHDAYTHGMGDFDYGYQATRKGIRVIQSAGFLGSCARNADQGSWRDRSLPRPARWKQLKSPKGLPFREWLAFNRRNSGWKWPLKTISPYLRVLLGL